jgi:metal-sulfur cluster biosynthetic enzyme
VRNELNRIIDPCSRAAGCPAGLDEMGLIRKVQIRPAPGGCDVQVVIGVTEYGCLMGAPFAAEAYEILRNSTGVCDVQVELDREFDWDRDDMRRDYQQRLQAHRSRRQLHSIPLVVVHDPGKIRT